MNHLFSMLTRIAGASILTAAIALASGGQAGAQTTEPAVSVSGLQFQIDPILSLSGLNEATLSYSFSGTGDRYTRVGLSLLFEHEVRSAETSETSPEPRVTTYDLMMRLHYNRVLRAEPKGSVFFYAGGGPRLGFGFLNQNTERDSFNFSRETNGRVIEAGIGFISGVEWFLHPNLSLMGEYGLNILYSYDFTDQLESGPTDSERTRSTSNGIELRGTGGRLGVSVYF